MSGFVGFLVDGIRFLLNAAAGLLGFVLLLRFWMQAVRIRPPNSIGPFVFQLSDWLVRPLRRLVPGVAGYDWASLLGAIIIALLATVISLALRLNFELAYVLTPWVGLFAAKTLLSWVLYGFQFSIFLEIIFSWVNPHAPLAPFVRALNDPLLGKIRRIIPPIGNLDLSAMFALLIISFIQSRLF